MNKECEVNRNTEPESLDCWQAKLEQHFSTLAASRQVKGMPVFALEHGLTQEEMNEIFPRLKARLQFQGFDLKRHWLLWVIYAAEQGYDYDGDEYWTTFEHRTPYWHNSYRNSIRGWFRQFYRIYRGVEPTGRWAGQFPIIAGPITHAILPKDMQLQMARTLHDLRYQLARQTFRNPLEIGRLLASSAGYTTSRFDNFLQQHELVGRIVTALVYNDPSIAGDCIYEKTLTRIVHDLEKVRNAREWLYETKRIVELVRLHGLESRMGYSGATDEEYEEQEPKEDRYNIRPKLVLWHIGNGTWKAMVHLHGFSSLIKQSSHLQNFFKETRCSVAGTDGRKHPGGWLLLPACKKALESWPDITKPILNFERNDTQVDQLIQSECRITSGPIWLFHIGADGAAREITSRLVCAGQKYIVLYSSALDSPMFVPCDLQCIGIQAKYLTIPATLTDGIIGHLKQLGLSVARTIRLWPAGMAVRSWDGVGQGEWLSTEAPSFGITHDAPVDSYALQLNGRLPVLIEAAGVSSPVFFQIPPLPAGRHALTVTAIERSGASSGTERVIRSGMISLLVRDPEPWTPGLSGHAGLTVFIDPVDPSLDSFLEGDATIHIYGPEGRQVACSIALMREDGKELASKEIGKFPIPIPPEILAKKIKDFADKENDPTIFLRASCGMFIVEAEELGTFKVPLYREALPLRWWMVTEQRKTILRLTDDTGDEEAELKVQFYSFLKPATLVSIAADTCLEGIELLPPGGLYIAEKGSYRKTLVASPSNAEINLSNLVIDPDQNSLPADIAATSQLLSLIKVWNSAPIAGPLTMFRRQRTVKALARQIYLIICGKRWTDAEQAFHDAGDNPVRHQQLQGNIDRRFGGFSSVLGRDGAEMLAGDYALCIQRFHDLASRYAVCTDRDVCDFAIRLACLESPFKIPLGENIAENIEKIAQYPVLLRGARLMVVFAQNAQQTRNAE